MVCSADRLFGFAYPSQFALTTEKAKIIGACMPCQGTWILTKPTLIGPVILGMLDFGFVPCLQTVEEVYIVPAAGEIYFTRHEQKVWPMEITFWVIWMVKTHDFFNFIWPQKNILWVNAFGWIGWNKSLLRLWLIRKGRTSRSSKTKNS